MPELNTLTSSSVKSKRLAGEAQVEAAAGSAIYYKAKAENRELTPAELRAFEAHKTKGEDLLKAAQRARADEEITDVARGLAEKLGLPGADGTGEGWDSSGGRTKAGAGRWGAALVKANSDSYGQFKALTTAGTIPVAVPLQTEPIRDSEPVRALRQLVPTQPAPGGRFSYLRQTVRTNNAAPVAEGALKPTSVYTLQRIDDRTRTIAHLSEPIPRQQIEDAPLLQQFVDDELSLGLDMALDAEMLTGAGTGEHLTGILATSGIQAQAYATDLLTTTRKAVTKLEAQNLAASGWVFSPGDWEAIELAAAAASAGNGNAPTPVDRMARRLWGVPVVVSTGIAAGTGLLGDFAGSAVLHVTEHARLDWSENVSDQFARNLVTFRCEMRAGLQVSRPLAFVSVDLTA